MINKENIIKLANTAIAEMSADVFIAEVLVKSDNRIYIFLESDNQVLIENCTGISKYVESHLDREAEDFELNVSSYGANQPLKFPRQYVKNIGRLIDVEKNDDTLLEGSLTAANEEGITIVIAPKKKKDAPVEMVIPYNEIKEARIKISFK
jgi:ribosome maturation factor RimP